MWILILTMISVAGNPYPSSIGVSPIFVTEASCKKAAEDWLKANKAAISDTGRTFALSYITLTAVCVKDR